MRHVDKVKGDLEHPDPYSVDCHQCGHMLYYHQYDEGDNWALWGKCFDWASSEAMYECPCMFMTSAGEDV